MGVHGTVGRLWGLPPHAIASHLTHRPRDSPAHQPSPLLRASGYAPDHSVSGHPRSPALRPAHGSTRGSERLGRGRLASSLAASPNMKNLAVSALFHQNTTVVLPHRPRLVDAVAPRLEEGSNRFSFCSSSRRVLPSAASLDAARQRQRATVWPKRGNGLDGTGLSGLRASWGVRLSGWRNGDGPMRLPLPVAAGSNSTLGRWRYFKQA